MATKLNPVVLEWTAPSENIDGTPITRDLSYRLSVDGTAVADFPGELNPDGTYGLHFSELGVIDLTQGTYLLTLQAFYTEDPALISNPSAPLTVEFLSTRPEPPLGLTARGVS